MIDEEDKIRFMSFIMSFGAKKYLRLGSYGRPFMANFYESLFTRNGDTYYIVKKDSGDIINSFKLKGII